MTPDTKTTAATRREFVKKTSAATAGLMLVKAESVYGAPANSAIQLAVIGCGGRGRYIGRFFKQHTDARIVALHDPFEDRIEGVADMVPDDKPKKFPSLDGYHEALEEDVDAAVITGPPYCHPEQCAAAVERGKHVYLAKPVAVDWPGCQSIMDSAQKAEGRLSFLVDFQTRSTPFFMEAAERVHRGDIGAIAGGQVFYQTGSLGGSRAPAGSSPHDKRLRDWVFDIALSGDIIVEQNVHVLDVSNWYLQAHPLRAFGTGGQKVRKGVGDCWDNFIVTYWYPNDVKIDFSSGQYLSGFHDMCIRMYGDKGTVDSHYGGVVQIMGPNAWHGTDDHDTFAEGAITNVKRFAESLKSGQPINNGHEAAISTATGVLGRMAAYSESMVTWDEMVSKNEKLPSGL